MLITLSQELMAHCIPQVTPLKVLCNEWTWFGRYDVWHGHTMVPGPLQTTIFRSIAVVAPLIVAPDALRGDELL